MLTVQGVQPHQELTFLTDGGETLRRLSEGMSPNSEHVLDWFHVTMRITQLGQMAKGILSDESISPDKAAKALETIKWKLWHGNPDHALTEIGFLFFDLDSFDTGGDDDEGAPPPISISKMAKVFYEFQTYIKANKVSIPNVNNTPN